MPDAAYHAAVDAGTLDGMHLLDRERGRIPIRRPISTRGSGAAPARVRHSIRRHRQGPGGGSGVRRPAKREAAYAKANDLIRQHVPMIPIGRATQPTAYRADVDGAQSSPVGLEHFAAMTPGDRRQLVWLTTSEPPGLYCADETDESPSSCVRS